MPSTILSRSGNKLYLLVCAGGEKNCNLESPYGSTDFSIRVFENLYLRLVSKINKINLSLSRSQLNQISVRESSFDKSTRVSMVQSLFNFSYYQITVSICIFVDLLLNFELEMLTIGQFPIKRNYQGKLWFLNSNKY